MQGLQGLLGDGSPGSSSVDPIFFKELAKAYSARYCQARRWSFSDPGLGSVAAAGEEPGA